MLLVAEDDLSESDFRELQSTLDAKYGKVKLITLPGNPRAAIVKTTNEFAPLLREQSGSLVTGGKRLHAILTSGAVGKLKKRASETKALGQVPQ